MPPPRSKTFSVVRGGYSPELERPAPIHDDWAALAHAAGSGDQKAIRTFLVTAGPQILRVVRRLLGRDHPDVEDVAQECAFAVIDALPSFRGECSTLHFVCRIAVLTAMNTRRRLRTLKRDQEPEGDATLAGVICSDPGPEQRLSTERTAGVVRELLSTLPFEQAEALAMHCVLGYTIVEIADASGTSAETWKSRLRLAKRALRRRVLDDPRTLELIVRTEDGAS